MTLDQNVLSELKKRVDAAPGKGRISVDPDDLQRASHDETEDFSFLPEIVVTPDTVEEVQAVMKFANEFAIPVTPRGAGTGLSGGALPIDGGIVVSLEKMNRILEIDEKNFFAVIEPGVITQTFQEAVEKKGLFYPPDPASRGSCTLGGNLAECSGGPRALKYGVTKDYIYGLEAVLPNGEIIHTGGKLLKNVTGYNLTQLLIGSEGTLGIITKITIKLIALPKVKKTLIVPFQSIEAAALAVPELFLRGITPCALELMEQSVIAEAVKLLGKPFPNTDAGAQLLIEVDGMDEEMVMKDCERLTEAVLELSALDVLFAETSEKQNELWSLRRACGEAVKKISPYRELDTVVPRAQFPDLIKGVKAICKEYDLLNFCYGHAGDGNVHVNVLKHGVTDEVWEKTIPIVTKKVFEHTVSLGGTLSGEHGVGWIQRDYMPIAMSPQTISIQRAIKRAFDPKHILNPKKVFPEEIAQV